jgi:Mn-dependent DtxR family transcriptional regulator
MNLQESGEMYLETIYKLTRESTNVRSIDIAESMGFSKPSISRAIGLLKSGGYITVSTDGFITLTAGGIEIAEKIYERHKILTSYLVSLGVPEEIASADACKIEHVISDESFEAIKKASRK